MATKYETVADIIAERDTLRRAVISAEGQWVGHKELVALRKDAERYRKLRRGQHWSVVNGIGDVLRADQLDAAVDAVPAVRAA